MNPYANLLIKVKALLKADDQLTKEQSSVFQWQQLLNIEGHDFHFAIGKGGVNTMFLVLDTLGNEDSRKVCYPEDALEVLEKLSKLKHYCYVALDAKKNRVGYSIHKNRLKDVAGATSICTVDFKGAVSAPVLKTQKSLMGKGSTWIENKR